jgi:hypothetical protein
MRRHRRRLDKNAWLYDEGQLRHTYQRELSTRAALRDKITFGYRTGLLRGCTGLDSAAGLRIVSNGDRWRGNLLHSANDCNG